MITRFYYQRGSNHKSKSGEAAFGLNYTVTQNGSNLSFTQLRIILTQEL
jgi:hypothetical protein